MADPESLVPRTSGVVEPERLHALPLAAIDRFVLSLVDGETPVSELAKAMDLDVDDVLASLMKLESMKLVVLPSPRATASKQNERTQASPSAPPSQVSPAPRPAAGGAFTAEKDVDLEPDHQRLIADIYDRLATLDHYALLGIPRTSDRKAIKRAYFEHTSRFHPDRFFRRKLGEAKLKMETIFGRMTEAHDTLTSADRRAEYDAYLSSVEKTRSIEQMLADATSEMRRAEDAALGGSSSPPPASSRRESARPSSLAPPPSSANPFDPPTTPNLGAFIADALDGKPPSKSPGGTGRISIVPPGGSQPPDARSRRELLARRLTGASVRVPPAGKVPSFGYVKTEDAVDALKRRYDDKVSASRSSQARKYSDAGMEAKTKGDMVAAANALRVALSFDPENAVLKTAHQEAQRAADQLLAEQYMKQAEYEERSERWADAGRSWQRVARARDTDARAHERAAHCILKATGNLHEAGGLAQRAVQLEPKNPAYRLTLANVYLSAGLTLNAKREVEAAVQLAPDDSHAAALLKRIAKSP